MTLDPIDCRGLVASSRWCVEQTEHGCVLWTGTCNDRGYGQVGLRNRVVYAHRVAMVAKIGKPIPAGMQVGHSCHDDSNCPGGDQCQHRRCVAPEHLTLQTAQENMHAGNRVTQALLARESCARGHRLVASEYPGRARSCRECVREDNRERARLVGQAARHLRMSRDEYIRQYGQSKWTAQQVMAVVSDA